MVQEKGSILVFALIVVAVLMVVGVTFTSVTTAEYRAAIAHTSSIQAFYVAEAGLAWAMQGILSGSLTFPTNLAVGQEHVVYRSAGFAGAE
ncbi:MAG: PilX N-terminal domain-containing pilus assembly protein, partial [Bacillota bacterium]|nr:PilX N-terminal domain-containing pilus assembly protein [Bacillota bacterium]